MYMRSAREAFERGKMRAWGIPDLPAWPGDGSTECLTNCRCHWEFEPWQGYINCYWIIDWEAENCQDCIDRYHLWNPWRTKSSLPQPPLIPPPIAFHPRRSRLIAQPAAPGSERIESMLTMLLGQLPDRHLTGIHDILVTELPPGYYWDRRARCWSIVDEEGCYTSLWDAANETIYLHPDHVGGSLFQQIAWSLVEAWAFNVFTPAVLGPILQYGIPDMDWSSIGLRLRSFYNAAEFATDAYQVWRGGTNEQYAALTSILADQGVDVAGLFGPRVVL
jgi:hypothetical protein